MTATSRYVTDAAIDAVIAAVYGDVRAASGRNAIAQTFLPHLEVAAPHIAVEILREAANHYERAHPEDLHSYQIGWIRAIAGSIEGGHPWRMSKSAGRPSMGKRRRINGLEQDVFGPWKHVYCYLDNIAGLTKWTKRQASKRERRNGKREAVSDA